MDILHWEQKLSPLVSEFSDCPRLTVFPHLDADTTVRKQHME
jgi:hypothetical protein